MRYQLDVTVGDYKFEFHEWDYGTRGELNTRMPMKDLSEYAIKKLCKKIPGLISISSKHQFTFIVERGNHLFPWEEIIDPLIQFLYDKNKPREKSVNEIENKAPVL